MVSVSSIYRYSIFTLLLALLTSLSWANDTDGLAGLTEQDVYPGVLIIKFEADWQGHVFAGKMGDAALDRIADRYAIASIDKALPTLDRMTAEKRTSLERLDELDRVYRMEFSGPFNPFNVAKDFARMPGVEYAEPLPKRRIFESEARAIDPNDPLFEESTHLSHIMAPEAWDIVKGEDGDVVVAVVDGGTEWSHADLLANIWTNPGEIPGNNMDDDGNGFIDDVRGWNFANNTNDPKGATTTPISSAHGTSVSGTISGVANNGLGITGMSWNAKVMPVNASNPDADSDIPFGYEGVLYAVASGADIINLSWGGGGVSQFERDVVAMAVANDVLIVTSSGNEGADNDVIQNFPSNLPGVLSVGATLKANDALASFSNYGMKVDVYGPGVSINTTTTGGAYRTTNGTSFSSPIVAGIAALVKTQFPDYSAQQVGEQIRATADNISAQNNTFAFRGNIGKGRVNALRAVTESTPSVRLVDYNIRDTSGDGIIENGEVVEVDLYLTNYLEDVSGLNVTLDTRDFRTDPIASTRVASLSAGQTVMATVSFEQDVTTPANHRIPFNVILEAEGYSDIDGFDYIANSTTHDTGPVQFTFSTEGNLGFDFFDDPEETEMYGFTYEGFNWIFEGGLIMGTSPATLSDNIRAVDADIQNDDFVLDEQEFVGIVGGRATKEEGLLQFSDANAETPLGLHVMLESYADTSDALNESIFLRYIIENRSATDIENFYAGLFFDWDTPPDPGSDYINFDEGRQMGIFHDHPTQSFVYIGMKLLNTGAPFSYRAINNLEIYDSRVPGGDGFTDQEKWDYISGGLQETEVTDADVSMLMAAGPFTMAPGETAEMAYALVAAQSMGDLNANADAAQAFWDNMLSQLTPNPVDTEEELAGLGTPFALHAAYPNPFSREATIEYQLPESSPVRIEVYDVLGRRVDVLVDAVKTAGRHTVNWDGHDGAGQRLANGMYLYRIQANTTEGPQTATRTLMLVR